MNRIGIAQVLRNAFGVLFRNFGIVLLIAVVMGGVGWAIADFIGAKALEVWKPATGQQAMVISQVSQTIWLTLWGCIVGAWAAPATLYLWVQHEKKKPASLYEAVNYGLNRFPRVVKAHARALFIVQLGMIVIVPGILFGLQYAFVDAIATLDNEEKDPLARSRKLTSGRRGTLFRTFAVFLLWWAPTQLGGFFWLQGLGTWALALGGVIDALVLIALDLCMVQFYLDLFRKPAAAAATAPVTLSKS
ncbi:MAG: hypothetical protein Q8P18_00670 [Pseudomonadota bacterium]|nr:hypothetical protein [Pseudomonadota bacterium]